MAKPDEPSHYTVRWAVLVWDKEKSSNELPPSELLVPSSTNKHLIEWNQMPLQIGEGWADRDKVLGEYRSDLDRLEEIDQQGRITDEPSESRSELASDLRDGNILYHEATKPKSEHFKTDDEVRRYWLPSDPASEHVAAVHFKPLWNPFTKQVETMTAHDTEIPLRYEKYPEIKLSATQPAPVDRTKMVRWDFIWELKRPESSASTASGKGKGRADEGSGKKLAGGSSGQNPVGGGSVARTQGGRASANAAQRR